MNVSLNVFIGVVCAAVLCLSSACSTVGKDFTAQTTASYSQGALNYQSSKNQENFKADVTLDADGKVTALHVETTALTPESAIAAQAQAQAASLKAFSEVIQALLPLLKTAGAAALAGS